MASHIEAVATAHARGGPFARDARQLADAAARACLARAGSDSRDIDLLINAGIYRKDNLAEPALASLIQEDIGANLGHPPTRGRHGTFSFDVANGGVGVLTGLELLDGFIRSGTIRTGMAVASDSNPGNTESFPFPAIGGAVLLRPTAEGGGFVDFAFETFDAAEVEFGASIGWNERARHLFAHGANILEIHADDGYRSHAVICATDAAKRFLARNGVEPHDVDLAVLSQSPAGFCVAVRDRLNLDPRSTPKIAESLANAHTAGIIVALEAAAVSGELAAARNVLFVTVGAGIIVGLALYRQ